MTQPTSVDPGAATLEIEAICDRLAALAHPARLTAFRELIAHGPEGTSAGVLGQAVNLAPNALSFHLNKLKQVGLVTSRRAGQQAIYRPALGTMRDLVRYLDATCCQALADGCGPQCAAD